MAMLFALVLLSILMASTMTVGAASDGTAAYATEVPVIDGDIDAVWDTTEKLEALAQEDYNYAYGYAQILWREDALYFLAFVVDETIAENSEDSTTNLVNFWVSETHSMEESYGLIPGDWYLPVNHAGNTYTYAGFSMEGRAEYAAKVYPDYESPEGKVGAYVVEVKVAVQTENFSFSGDSHIGFSLSIDDDVDGDNVRDWYCTTQAEGSYWSMPWVLDRVTLLSAPNQETESSNTESSTPSASTGIPDTSVLESDTEDNADERKVLPILLVAAVAVVAVVAVLIVKKKKA